MENVQNLENIHRMWILYLIYIEGKSNDINELRNFFC